MGLDGVIERVFEVIGSTNKYFVEIGYNTDHWSEGSNTCNLHLEHAWSGLLLDARFENASINLHKHFVTVDNIVGLFDKYNVPLEPDYVSIGIVKCVYYAHALVRCLFMLLLWICFELELVKVLIACLYDCCESRYRLLGFMAREEHTDLKIQVSQQPHHPLLSSWLYIHIITLTCGDIMPYDMHSEYI
jgi:hypothetical protein